MKNERILLVDDNKLIRESILFVFEVRKEGGHQIVGATSSVEETEELLKTGIRPTVALEDGLSGAGERAASLIKKYSPETKIIAFSKNKQSYGDAKWDKAGKPEELIQFLTDLQH